MESGDQGMTDMPGLEDRTVNAVLRRGANDHPDRLAVRDHSGSLTYGELVGASGRAAGGMDRIGVGRQDPPIRAT